MVRFPTVKEGNYLGFGHFPKSKRLLLPLPIFWFSGLGCLLVFIAMKKGETFAKISGAGKGEAVVEKKGKRASHCTRIRMDFDPKASKLGDQEAVYIYLANYEFCLNLGIKIEFCPHGVEVSSASPKREGVYMHL